MSRQLIDYFGHHKCGTSWIVEVLLDVARRAGLKPAYVHNDESFGGDLAGFVLNHGIELLLYVNADIEHVQTLGPCRGFHVLELRLEQLSQGPVAGFLEAFRFVGLGLPEAELRDIIDSHSFERKSGGRSRGEERPDSHYRKGVAGDWVNHFHEEHRACFKKEFPDIVERLGYESAVA